MVNTFVFQESDQVFIGILCFSDRIIVLEDQGGDLLSQIITISERFGQIQGGQTSLVFQPDVDICCQKGLKCPQHWLFTAAISGVSPDAAALSLSAPASRRKVVSSGEENLFLTV